MLLKTTNKSGIYSHIIASKAKNQKLLAILLDPDKIIWETIDFLILKINDSPATHLFIGGSHVISTNIDALILKIKLHCNLPVVLFPGNPSQISGKADAILFLSLISGRNPDFLIGHQVDAVPILKKTILEVISTGYILIESGHQTAVARVSNTSPLSRNDIKHIVHTAQAGEMLGQKLIYLEAGSGANDQINPEIVMQVSNNVSIPVIVGGGIINQVGIREAFNAGADLVVIGTAFENDINFFNDYQW